MQFMRSAALCLFVFFLSASSALADTVIAGTPVAKRQVEVAFVLDTTGSMAGLIDGAKKKIWSIANTIVDQYPDAEIRFGLVGYRDIGDEYVTKEFPLTTDIQSIYAKLLAFKADGGGDTPESVNEALDVAVTKLGWSDKNQVKADRILFLVGDAPPHMDYKQDRKYPVIIAEAVKKGIVVNAVQAGNMDSTREIWKEMASLGKGDYLPIPQDGGRVIVIDTPYDKEILIIQRKLNMTVVPYGSRALQKEVEVKATVLYESAPMAEAADMASYVNKSGRGRSVVTGGGDLVADVKEGRKKLAEVPKKELPEDMQKMSADEQTAYLEVKAGEREELSRQLAALVSKRDEFILEQEKAKPRSPADSFDTGVKRTLEKQMK